jgi:hypothetical protein
MSAPKKGTPEYELWISAIDLATSVSLNPTGARTAQVPWRLITELRDVLDKLHIDWRGTYPEKSKKSYDRHRPTEQHQYDDPSGPLLCTCGALITFYRGSTYGSRGWGCSTIGKPTAAFAKLPQPLEDGEYD